jgi:hypothetical protein
MPIRNRFFPGSSVSRYLPPGETGYASVVYQSGRPVLDAELNLDQDLRKTIKDLLLCNQSHSGWLRGQTRADSYSDFSFDAPWLPGPTLNPDFTANTFHMRRRQAVVAGYVVDIEFTNTDTANDNLIQLDPPTIFNGTPPSFKRTDFVFLEVWLAQVQASPTATGSFQVGSPLSISPGDTVTVDGVVLTATAGVPAANEFMIAGSAPATAIELASAITTFVPTARAQANGPIVTVIAEASGAAGNAITLASSIPAVIIPSGATLTGGSNTPNKPDQDLIYRHGNVQSSAAVALPDDLADPTLVAESARRVQVQYRIRATGVAEGVNFRTQPDGFSNQSILAQGAQTSPVTNYPFVPADLTSFEGNSDARDQVGGPGLGYGKQDNGLFIAGDGSQASALALGSVDGFVYAIPIAFVFRRNDAFNGGAGTGWSPANNTNGALPHDHGGFTNSALYGIVDNGESDRPDGSFADAIVETDMLDLRRHVMLNGVDLQAELQHQMKSLLDGNFRTWAIDTSTKQVMGNGTGDVSTQFLVCDQIGRTETNPPGLNGTAPLSGNTTNGETVRNFDHVARRFADQSIVERAVFELRPTDTQVANPGKYVERAGYAGAYLGWAEQDIIHIDLANLNASTLGNYLLADATLPTGNIFDFMPAGTTITNVLTMFHDDGNFTTVVPQELQASVIQGLGTEHVTIQMDTNLTQVNQGLPGPTAAMVGSPAIGDQGSQRRVFIELEITYPPGNGITNTPDLEVSNGSTDVYPFGPFVENDISLAQRPLDMESPIQPSFRPGFREVTLEYIANDPTGGGGNNGAPVGSVTPETLVSRDNLSLVLPRRAWGSFVQTMSVTDQNDLGGRVVDDGNTEYGSSSRFVQLQNSGFAPAVPLSGTGQTQVAVEFFAQDPIPQAGPAGAGYQVGVYYRSNAPQTAGTKEGVVSTTITSFPYTGAGAPLPAELSVEPLVMSPELWTGVAGMGTVDPAYPYSAPLDQIPVNDQSTSSNPPPPGDEFPGEWYFVSSALISIDDFDADTGLLSLHPNIPADGTQGYTLGGVNADQTPIQDVEFRVAYPIVNETTYRPSAFAQPLSGINRHKVFFPMLARSRQDSALFRKDELLLVVITRWAELDADNTIKFLDVENDNRACAGVYRTRGLLLLVGNGD